ncbi:hypothetical protein F4810DRAFT_717659 [Camillea tinctor]|nr:hypothetical protein F4810DRAFT_717659 [Camillea tinctor]
MVCYGPGGKRSEVFARPWRKFGSLRGFGRHYESWEEEDLQPSQTSKQQGSYLLRRGWVLQETFLPRCALHFLPGEVTWKCASASLCECQLRPPDKLPHRPLDLEEPKQIDTRNLKEFWKEITDQYTQRQLTYPSDHLAALAGIARHAHSASPDIEYYAGLWLDTLPSTLLWVVIWPVESGRDGYDRRPIEPAIAPTWSWASVTGLIEFLFWNRNFGRGRWANSVPDFTDIHVCCPPSGKNKYGTISSGKLTAEGYLLQVHISLTGGSRRHVPIKMESRKPGSEPEKSIGYLYPDTEEVRASL